MATLLIIDGVDRQRVHVRDVLAKAGLFERIVLAEEASAGLRILGETSIDVVLCCHDGAGSDAMKLLGALDTSPAARSVPILCLTMRNDPEDRAQLLESGSSDVLRMPFHPAELVARLRIQLGAKRLRDDLRIKHDTLERLSPIDPQTGLRGRQLVEEMLSTELLRARRFAQPLTILIGQLDHIERVNLEHGPGAGESVLRSAASLLLEELRKTDVAGRQGEDEILVVLGQNEISGARILAERWRSSVEDACFPSPAGKPLRVTISIGAASLGEDTVSSESLLGAAHAALERARDSGGNRVELAGPGGRMGQRSSA